MGEKFFFSRGKLKDEKIISALTRCAADYENGEIIEVRDVLADIVSAIDLFSEYYKRKNGG